MLAQRQMIPLAKILGSLGILALTLSACASANEEIDHFGYAASTPIRDFNFAQHPIPRQLLDLQNPYGTTRQSGCAVWAEEINQLSTALFINRDRRVGFRRDGRDLTARTGNLRDTGVAAASTSFIPFRSVVRELSGAAQLEREAAAASDRGRHRIGYLIGLGRASRCPGFNAPHLDYLDPSAVLAPPPNR